MSVSRGDIFTMRYFDYGEAFTGSDGNLRYRIGREPLENIFFTPEKRAEGTLRFTVYPGPYSYEVTPDEQKIVKDFEFSEEGLVDGIEWINMLKSSGDYD